MNSYIKAIEYFFPENRLDNLALTKEFPDWSPEKIEKKTGIKSRYIVDEEECASDLGVNAAKKIFSSEAVAEKDIDFILFCSESPDYILPPTACLIQDRLGIGTCAGAFDINLGCSGFVYGLGMAQSLVCSGQARNVLLINAETYSKHIHPLDKSVRTVFGDGAAATVISACDDGTESRIGPFVYGTDGSGYHNLIVPVGGCRNKRTRVSSAPKEDSFGSVRSRENLYMNGPEIFNFTIKTVPVAVENILKKSGLDLESVDHVVFHQANDYMLKHLRKKIGISEDKFYVNLKDCGNTVSASIPIALKMAVDEKKIASGDKIMLVGFGVGYSWAAAMIEWV
jgi:3-oxoacyl-[acyl-carrier-protein] synthase-3